MYKTMIGITTVLFCMTGLALAEPQTGPASPSVNVQLNTEFLNDLMRSAAMFNGMVQNLNLNRTLHESGVAPDSTDQNGRPIKHTAAVLGAGAGVGMAVGSLTGNPKGAMIGAAVGGASALIIDQILQHQAKERLANPDAYRDNQPENNRNYDHDLRQLKQREPQQ
jgi:Glycine zipper